MDGLDRPPRSKGPLVAVLGLVVAAALGVTIYVVMNSGGDDVKTTAAATVEPPKSNGVDESSSGDDDPQNNETEIGEPGAGGVKAPPPVEKVKIEITSTPKGALVRGEERKLLGETPFSIEVDKSSEERVFHVSQFGFEPTEVKLVPDQDRTENVVLERPEVASKSRDRKAKKKSSRKPVTRSVPTVDPLDQLNKKKKKRKTGFGQTVDPLGD
jgi:hypothetical protein